MSKVSTIKVIILCLACFILGIIIAPSKTVEVEKEVIVEKEIIVEGELGKMVIIYEQILNVDSKAFTIAADNMDLIYDAAVAGFDRDITEIERITGILDDNNNNLTVLADKRNKLLAELELLK